MHAVVTVGVRARSREVSLAVECTKLRLLDEVILAVLEYCLVVEPSDASNALALRLSVLVCILHLLLPLLHVARPDRLHLVVQRTAQHVLSILEVQPRVRSIAQPARLADEDLVVVLIALAIAVVLEIVHVLLVRQVEAGTVGHVHFEAAGGEALGL